MSNTSNSSVQNLLPVQAYFDVSGNFQTFIGQNKPFFANINPIQSGLTITNSTIDSTIIGANVPSTGVFTSVSATSGSILNTPVNPTDIANKFYVDTVAQGLGPKAACQVATLANITLSGLQTIDGYTTLAGDRVLVKNQTNNANNGIYIASTGTWSRSPDMNTWSEVPGAYTVILNGSQANTAWVCNSAETGTIGTTAITWVMFSGISTYSAGTGLSLSANTFSISNTSVTSGSYGSSSNVPTFTVNAQGQLTAASNTPIAIAASQITSGTIASSLISGSYTGITGVGTLTAGVWNATPIANAYLANSGITINGNAVSLGGSTTVTANTPNALTFNNSGSGASSGTTFNGSTAQTISYNTIGSPSTTGTNATGTWGINITGSASSATTATTATNLAGGSTYALPYQTSSGTTNFLSAGTSGSLLMTLGTIAAPIWVGPSSLTVGTATNIGGGAAGSLPYQTGSGATTFLGLGTSGYVLSAGASAPQYVAQSTLSVGTATNLAGGNAGYVPYQSASGTTTFLSAGTSGQVLTSNGTSAPTWTTPTAYATVTDDTTTNATRYPLFANQTSGNISTEYTSSTKLQYNPSTGIFTSTYHAGFLLPTAGTSSVATIQLSSGALLTTPNQGAVEFDGSATYITGAVSSGNGRQIVQASQVAQLATSATVASGGQFFTSTVRPYLVSGNLYKISYICIFSTSANQTVTFSFSNSAAVNFTNLNATMALVQEGYGATSISSIYATGAATTTQQASLTLTSGNTYIAQIEGYVMASANTRLQLIATSASGITSQLGSYFVVTDVGTTNIGNIG